jgi:hypothetical protein
MYWILTKGFTGLAVGNYSITVTNPATGVVLKPFIICKRTKYFDLTIDNVVDVTCLAGTDGSVDVTFIDRCLHHLMSPEPCEYTVFDIANPLSPCSCCINIWY